MADRTCSDADCELPVRARGMCVNHYQRWRVHTIDDAELCESFVRECLFCGKGIRVIPALADRKKFCSRKCHGSWQARNISRPTGIERALAEALARAGIRYKMHEPVESFVVDFLLADGCTIVEADGSYWHSLPHNIERDQRKDRVLTERGFTVVRFTEGDINSDPDACVRRLSVKRGAPFLPLLPGRRVCSIGGCERPHASRGWCSAHYQQWCKHGDPTYRVPEKPIRLCSVEGCGRKHVARGFCISHWNIDKTDRVGRKRFSVGPAQPGETPCSDERCDRAAKNAGMCGAHYQRWYKAQR